MVFSKESFLKLWTLGSKVLITNLITNFIGNIDSFIIGKVYGINPLGLYSRAKGLVNVVNSIFIGSLNSLSFSLLSKNNDNFDEFVRLHKKIFSYSFFLLIIITILISANSEAIIISLYSEKWRESIVFLEIMIFLLFPIFTNAFSSQTLLALGDGSYYLKLFLVKKMILIFVFPVAYIYDLKTFVYSYVLLSLTSCFIDIYFLSKRLKISYKFYFSDFKMVMPISVIAFGCSYLTRKIFIEQYMIEQYIIIMFVSLIFSSVVLLIFLELFKPINYIKVRALLINQIKGLIDKNK